MDGPVRVLPSLPQTPSHKNANAREVLEKTVDHINRSYDLAIKVPDGSLTPSARKQHANGSTQLGRWSKICSLVQYLHFQPRNVLERALLVCDWKFKAFIEELPRSNALGLTDGQRCLLEEKLVETLGSWKGAPVKPLNFGTAVAGPRHASTTVRRAPARTTRPSISEQDSTPFKRVNDGLEENQEHVGRYDLRSGQKREDDSTRSFDRSTIVPSVFDNDHTTEYSAQETLTFPDPSQDSRSSSAKKIQQVQQVQSNIAPSSYGLTSSLGLALHESTSIPLPASSRLGGQFANIFPGDLPPWLRQTPFPLVWELVRICRHCNVDLENLKVSDPGWNSNITTLLRTLRNHDLFRGKTFPGSSAADAFNLKGASVGKQVVLAIELDYTKDGKMLFSATLKPLKLEQGCRLTRHFGHERFIQLFVPALDSNLAATAVEDIQDWLNGRHSIMGRKWKPFFMRRISTPKKSKKAVGASDGASLQVFLFAESELQHRQRPVLEPIPVDQMLDWLLHLKQNHGQPALKLFSRIALGLSNAWPTITFEPQQIRHEKKDLYSRGNNVKEMNDGIGRMSRAAAFRIRDICGLRDVPAAVQGRLGSAKGMWLLRVMKYNQKITAIFCILTDFCMHHIS